MSYPFAEPARSLSLFALLLVAPLAAACGAHAALDDADAGATSTADAGAGLGVGVGHAGSKIYVTLAGADQVITLDATTLAQQSSVKVGKGPAIVLATPDGAKLYIANWTDNTVSSITTADNKVTSIPLAGRPYVIAMDGDGTHVYAGLNPTNIAVINTKTDLVERTITTPDLPAAVIVSHDGKTIYIATVSLGPGTLRAISAASGAVIHPAITVGSAPGWITLNPAGTKLYTLNLLSDDVTVVDTKSWTVDATVKTGAGSQAIICNVTPDGSALYLTKYGTAELASIDTKTNTLARTIKLDGKPVGVNFSQDGKLVYVTDLGPTSLTSSPLPFLTFTTGGPYTATGNGQVSAYDVATGVLVGKKVTVGVGPTSVVAPAD